MRLFNEGTLVETYEMADALLNSYGILDKSEWMDHFSEIIGSFCEITGYPLWDSYFECLGDVKAFKSEIKEECVEHTNGVYLLSLVNTVIGILRQENKKGGEDE